MSFFLRFSLFLIFVYLTVKSQIEFVFHLSKGSSRINVQVFRDNQALVS